MKKAATISNAYKALKKPLQMMKLMTVFLFFFVAHSRAGAGAQTITLTASNQEIAKVLTEIEKQGHFRFLYNSRISDLKQRVSVAFTNANINDVMLSLFRGTTLKFRLMENNLVAIRYEAADKKLATIIGKVTDGAGNPVTGATILVKGTSTGTSTDTEGNFTINAPEDATLVVSAIGYTDVEVPVAGKTQINVTLVLAQQQMDEVVVVGYGTQRKRDLTGSITSVKGEELANMPNTNPVSSLQGKVAGLTVSNSGAAGSSPTVRIRGTNSTNSASPVYVVDGILHDNIDFLNPADIESIDVLRDPSSIAIYGLRGANGVIAITSKKAARGQTRINLQSTIGIQTVVDKIDVTDAAGFKKLYDAQLANINAAPFDYTNYTANTNWQDQIFRDAMISTNNLSVSNSTEKTSTLLNIGYTNQDGVLRNDNFQRYLVRLNEEIRINSNIKIGGDITGYHFTSNPATGGLTNALWAAPIVPIQQDADTYYSMPSFQRAQVGNPVATINRNDRTSINKGFRVIGNVFAEVKFLRNFTWRSVVYTDLQFNNNRSYTPLPYTFINLGEGAAPTSSLRDNTIRTGVAQSQSESRRFQQDHTLNFVRTVGDGHSLNVLAGFTTIYSQGSSINGNRRDTTVNVPNSPDFWYLNTINNNNPGLYGGGGSENSIVGGFGRMSYSYKGRYLLNATVRRDGSSKFAPENRWGTFGSVGVGWVISDENFFADIKGLDFLKFRGAWGQTGNANGFADNLYRPGISNASTAIFGNSVYTAIQAAYIPDPNLGWEVVTGIDLGIDLRAFRNRFNAEITYYNRTTKDILTALTLPNETRSYFTNLGEITNTGIELGLGWNDKIGRDWSYNISGNMSYNHNVVNSIGDRTNFQLIGNSGANLTTTGNSIGYFYGYRQNGVYQSTSDLSKTASFTNSLPGDISYEDVNSDGKLDAADRTYLGTPFPPYNFGGSFTLNYKNFDFSVEAQGVAGNKIYTQRRTANFATLNYEANRLNAWTAPGTSNVEPILDNTRGNNFLFSSYFLEPGDYLRLRTLQFGYTFRNTGKGALGIKTARFYVNGQNIKNWSQVTGYSPEAQIGNILGGGADNGVYPVPAVYTFGMNLTF